MFTAAVDPTTMRFCIAVGQGSKKDRLSAALGLNNRLSAGDRAAIPCLLVALVSDPASVVRLVAATALAKATGDANVVVAFTDRLPCAVGATPVCPESSARVRELMALGLRSIMTDAVPESIRARAVETLAAVGARDPALSVRVAAELAFRDLQARLPPAPPLDLEIEIGLALIEEGVRKPPLTKRFSTIDKVMIGLGIAAAVGVGATVLMTRSPPQRRRRAMVR